jgi:pimeloyl-ACP methyl ester carboxylesterase
MIVPIRRACRRLPVRLAIVVYLATVGGAVSWAQAPRRPLAHLLGPQGLLTSGQYLWADELVFPGYRIQRNTLTGGYRLLDAQEVAVTSGSFTDCQARLQQIRRERALPPLKPKVVLILHGLADRRRSGQPMADYLQRNGDYQAFALGYPSLFEDLGPPAKSLANVIAHLEGVQEIDLVAHSLGNLVIRQYYGDMADPTGVRRADPRLKRIVMVGPPNDGTRLMNSFNTSLPEYELTSRMLSELGRDWAVWTARLGVPTCEFGILAGGTGQPGGFNPRMPGDNDGLLEVQTTRLPGASDFLVVPTPHSGMLHSAEMMRYTLNFLQHGYFVSVEQKRPIPAATQPPKDSHPATSGTAREF